MAILSINNVSKSFGALKANDGITLSLGRGEILGLLGENGAGKTTLMNILFGHYVADTGEIVVDGVALQPGAPKAALTAGIGMVHQHFTLAENLTVLDNIILGTESLWRMGSGHAAARARLKQLAVDYGLAVDPDAAVTSLSVGERQRVEILKALYRNARILILDEPTAVLTPQESTALFETLKKFVAKGLSIIFISHKLGEIMDACQRVAILRGGKLVAERSVKDVTRGELAELMIGGSLPELKHHGFEPGRVICSIRNLSVRKENRGLVNCNLSVRTGEIVGIAGVSGNGQSLLSDVLCGTLKPNSGEVAVDGKVLHEFLPRLNRQAGIARIPEDRHGEGMIGDMNVEENLALESYNDKNHSYLGFLKLKVMRSFALKSIEANAVACRGPTQPVRQLSGGNMQKLLLSRALLGEHKVVVANQPSRGLDVGAVAHVHQTLLWQRAQGRGIFLISEDLDELLRLSDTVCVMFRGALSRPMQRADVTMQSLGLMMAGQGLHDAA